MNYNAAVEEASGLQEAELVEPALYQMVRAGLATPNLTVASNALQRILASYPKNFHTERAVLLFGQRQGSEGSPAIARQLFQDFLAKAPESALRPELELALARTYEEERLWTQAMEEYDSWLADLQIIRPGRQQRITGRRRHFIQGTRPTLMGSSRTL